MQKKQTTVLAIIDGFGVRKGKDAGETINEKTAPYYFELLKKYPHAELAASGEAVGLFKGQEGNSEAGHFNLGAGRVVKQDVLYVSDAIADGTFFKNNAFHQALHHLKKYNTAAHVVGLLSNHNSAHSCPEHLYALLDFLHREKVEKVYLHLFTDGRDSGQHDALAHYHALEPHLHGNEQVATIMGRFYGMDRNKDWARTQKAYEAIVCGKGCAAKSVSAALTQAYNKSETDEYICPTVISRDHKPAATVKDNDVLFFFNLRSDRARQLTKTFVQADFEKVNPKAFQRCKVPKNIRFVAMTDFGPDLPGILTAFPSRDVHNSLVRVLCPLKQMYVAESEKFAHITYFFNGGYAKRFCDENWVKIPSPAVDNYCQMPEMSAAKVADTVIKGIKDGAYDFIALNFANPDMVGHTGDLAAGKKAVQAVDKELKRLVEAILSADGKMIITADHGNVEEMINEKTGEVDTEHSIFPVPCILIGKDFVGKKILKTGKLADVAPTVLKIMGLKKPKEMTGKALF